jgi:hypothetical protein
MNFKPPHHFKRIVGLFIASLFTCLYLPGKAATFTVINTNDAGAGSLRQAIINANATVGMDLINFAIPAAPYIISLLSSLPTITDFVTIDGDSQAGWVATPIIELNGAGAGAGVDGLTVTAGGCTIKGLVIYSFSGNGILITTIGNNTITGNYIGTNAAGTLDMGNTLNGILIQSSSSNTIGNTVVTDRNLISGNDAYGINITTNCDANVIVGNYIGVTAAGNLALGNSLSGIIVQNSCTNTFIGGTIAGDKNVISGNLNHGIHILNNCTGTKVGAAYIGTDFSGNRDLGNSMDGIRIQTSSTNDIGGNFAGPRNIISGNDQNGVNIMGISTNNNIYGNYIGLNAGGTVSLGNSFNGVCLQTGATANVVGGSIAGEGNVISGNTMHGVYFLNTTKNYIRGNYIGLTSAGTAAKANTLDGIRLETSTASVIGGTAATERNVISGNGVNGINLMSNSNNDTIKGNYIGLQFAGAVTLGNTLNGIIVQGGSTNNLIGGITVADRNVISGNLNNGIYILNTTSNFIKGNYIGINQAGTAAIKNFQAGILIESSTVITVGGTTVTERNVVSGNAGNGVSLLSSTGITVSGNYIGMNPAGTGTLNNTLSGIMIQSSSSNLIGGSMVGERNIIAGNSANGVNITTNSSGNNVKGNYIGLDPTGVTGNINALNGIFIQAGSTGNSIGGSLTGERNVISWSLNHGIYVLNANGNFIRGNYIGTDFGGTIARKNFVDGIRIENSSSTLVGGTTALEQNIISGNGANGITLINGTSGTVVSGNYVGLNATGTPLANVGSGILIQTATGNTIGGSTAGERNIISGNANGVNFTTNANNNIVAGNYIGTNVAGTAAIANGVNGVFIQATSNNNVIGGLTVNERNIISGNSASGINITGSSNGNSIQQNYIGTDVTGMVNLFNTTTAITIVSSNSTLIGGSTAQQNILVGKVGAGTILSITGTSTGTDIRGNYIGINVTGIAVLGCATGISDVGTGTIVGGTNVTDRNIISGCSSFGMVVGGTGFTIQGNYIGTNAAGTAALGNSIGLSWSANNETLGGLAPGAGNLISGNGGYGVEFFGSSGNFVLGNLIGTDYTGTSSIANYAGIQLSNASTITIGGTTTGARNVISGNTNGINASGAHNNTIIGNYIGTEITGTTALGNTANGIYLGSGSYSNAVGGTTAGTPNIIAYNGDDGVEVNGSTSITNPIRQNSIYCNTGKGINLNYSTGVQGNNGYPKPVILAADNNGANGTSSPNALVELFYGACGQGQQYIVTVTADAAGVWAYVGTLTLPNCLIATETSSTNNTSEFSTCVIISNALSVSLLNFDAYDLNGKVNLVWSTTNEKDNDYFIIERSEDGNYFQEIGKVKGAGNSSVNLDYSFLDQNCIYKTLYYRLKQADYDGKFIYSKKIKFETDNAISAWKAYPNPSNGFYRIAGNSLPDNLELINIYGVSSPIEMGEVEGTNFTVDLETAAIGIYYLKIKFNDHSEIIKLIKSQ